MAEALALGASIIAVIQISASLVSLASSIYKTIKERNRPSDKFRRFLERLKQLLNLARQVRQQQGTRHDYRVVYEWLLQCETFLETFDFKSSRFSQYLGLSTDVALDEHHRLIDNCYQDLTLGSNIRLENGNTRIERVLGILDKKMCVTALSEELKRFSLTC